MNPNSEQSNSPCSPFSVGGVQRFQRAFFNPVLESSTFQHSGHKFHEVFQMKQGRYADLPPAKISEMMKSNSLDSAPTQSLLSVVNGILDEGIERKNGEIPQRVACLLRKVVQEIERRISTQAEHLRTQNNLFKAREEKYQSRIKVLEALANGTSEENEIAMNQLEHVKNEKSKTEEKMKLGEEDMEKLMKERDQCRMELASLKQQTEKMKISHELQLLQMERDTKGQSNTEIATLKQELENTKKSFELQRLQMEKDAQSKTSNETVALRTELETATRKLETANRELETVRNENKLHILRVENEAKITKTGLEDKIKDLERNLADSQYKVRLLEANTESKCQSWTRRELRYTNFINWQFRALQELRVFSSSCKQEISKAQENYFEELNGIGKKLLPLGEAAEKYRVVMTENRKLFYELQELKGNIRVYCRVRPFLPGQETKRMVIEYAGEQGELVVSNPSRPGKEGFRHFKFNKVYGPEATQAQVFSDTQPLIRSVLDGYNVCIFAYGQTGSGKTYTMSGPNGGSEEDWGVNYRALNDLFRISQSRKDTFMYEIGVQMVEIYNEQVLDLLSDDNSQRKLGIVSAVQSHGLATPDACMYSVKSTSDVVEIMSIGLKNRAVGATALNEHSSRSHSIVSIHVRGKDLKTSAVLFGNLHLIDLAGSERIDRSEATGDRLKEAQHINKSLSALGDVISALATKASHVPYRNSKLTQILQSSLGGQAKTLMFVQINPDAASFTESMSTLKFAERVSGVELGAPKSNKDGRDIRDLMEQLASLKDTIARKDDEIERLHLLKDLYPLKSQHPMNRKILLQNEDSLSDQLSEVDSQQSMDDRRQSCEGLGAVIGYDDGLSEASDGAASVGTDASLDYARSIESKKVTNPAEKTKTAPRSHSSPSSPRPPDKMRQAAPRTAATSKSTTNTSAAGLKKIASPSSLVKTIRRWH